MKEKQNHISHKYFSQEEAYKYLLTENILANLMEKDREQEVLMDVFNRRSFFKPSKKKK